MSNKIQDFKDTMASTNEVSVMSTETSDDGSFVEVTVAETKSNWGNISNENDENEFSVFTRKTIEELDKAVNLVDTDEETGLEQFCYVKCTNTDSDLLKQCRGVVFHGEELVMKAFPYTTEFNHTELPLLEEVFKNFSKFSFYDAYEGALLRVFHFNGKWFLSTHRKLNAFRSKWSSKDSFGTHFKKALVSEVENNKELRAKMPQGVDNVLEQFYSILDPTKQYMFLVLNGEDNRIVCKPAYRPTLFFAGTFKTGETDVNLNDSFPIPRPQKHTWLNIDEMLDYVSKIDYSQLQGVIGFGPNNTQVKVLHKEYQDLFRARGNEPSVKFRYLQVRMTKKFVDMLYYLYPNCIETFDDYENTLFEIARGIYKSYVKRFIKKTYVTVHPDEFQVIKECHSWHLSDRETNRISLEKVIAILNKQSPTSLNHMIRRFKTEQTKKKEEKDEINMPRTVKGSPMIAPTSDSTPLNSPLLLQPNVRLLVPPKLEL